jgi:hypothetical protein
MGNLANAFKILVRNPELKRPLVEWKIVLSRNGMTIYGIWIDNRIYWILNSRLNLTDYFHTETSHGLHCAA